MLKLIASEIKKAGGRAYYVGGYVRDKLLGIKSKDIDIEVYDLEIEKLKDILSNFGEVDLVGKSFGILKLKGTDWDFALPRKEKKIFEGHKGFEVNFDPTLSFDEACKRRDFTINAILEDVLTGKIIDPFNGQNDLKKKVIRHIDSIHFPEDPLRVYRAAQFAARFQFKIAEETLKLCTGIDLSSLSKERIFTELEKMLLKSSKPSIGLEYLRIMKVIHNYHPVLARMIDCEQDQRFHPEGDVWQHTLLVVDETAKLRDKSKNPLTLMLAALCHDVGKPLTLKVTSDKITNYGHAEIGADLTREYLSTLTNNKKLIDDIVALVKEHMNAFALYKQSASLKAIHRLSQRVDLSELLLLAEADYKGRGNGNKDFNHVKEWYKGQFRKLKLQPGDKIIPLVSGKDLIKLGYQPGKHFKNLLDKAMELQLEGLAKEEILEKIKIPSKGNF